MYSAIYAPQGRHGRLGRMIAKDINVPCLPLKSRKKNNHSVRTFTKKTSENNKKIINK